MMMPVLPETIPPPSDDKRWQAVMTTMRRHGYSSGALIETLHSVQQAFGYLDDSALKYVAHSLKVPLSKVYGVATFYHLFRLKPEGEHTCVVCLGTACYIYGGSKLLTALENHAGIKSGQTTPDKQLSLSSVRCLGICGTAPIAVFDGQVVGNLTPADAEKHLEKWSRHEP